MWIEISQIIGGLALFMYGVTLLRETLGKISGKSVVRVLEKVSNNPVKGMAAGTAVTFMTQSSSITVLTLIGFVNAGMMTFRQSVNVMLGSEIGTTVTAQLVSFNIGGFFWPLVAIGFFMKMFSKNERVQLTGTVIFSLGLLFLSMHFMKEGAGIFLENEVFNNLIENFGAIPILGILIGALIAGITQSSSATTSLVIAMGAADVIELGPAIALVMGANIGTCFLELFAGIGATTPAKRTAIAQTMINIFGVAIFLPFLTPFAAIVELTDTTNLARQIANAHTIFNVIVSLIFIPLVGLLVRFCERLIPDKEGEVIGKHYFDEEMLHMPQAALLESERETLRTAKKTIEMIVLSKTALLTKNLDDARRVISLEDEVDEACRDTEDFIDLIREEELNHEDAIWRIKLLAILTDIERVGDLASNIAEFVLEKLMNGIEFSEVGKKDITEMFDLVEETYSTAIKALETKNKDLAKVAEKLEDDIDVLERKLKAAHVSRVRSGVCDPQADAVFVETLRNLERIGDHADNIAYDVIMDT